MSYRLLIATLFVAMAIGPYAQTPTNAADDATGYAKTQWRKDYGSAKAPVNAALTETAPAAAPRLAQAGPVLRMRLRPVERPPYESNHYSYDNYYGYIPGDYSREGFIIEDGNWWIGNQPYLPYYGYNPPTIDGYYPPYAYGSPYYGSPYYGYGGGNYSNYGQIVPAPPLASPPAYIPSFTTPLSPAPMRIRIRRGGITVERDPHFRRLVVPRPPEYLTTGSAIYQTPPPYYYYPPFPPPRRRR